MVYLADVVSTVTGEHYTRDFPTVDIFAPRVCRSRRSTPAPAATPARSRTAGSIQVRDDVSLLKGNHALKIGVNFNYLWHLGILNGNEHYATRRLLRRSVDDPQQHQRPVSAGLPDARHREPVAAGQRRRGQRSGVLGGHDQQRAADLDVVPGRLAHQSPD